MSRPYTGPGAAGSFGSDPASQEFIAETGPALDKALRDLAGGRWAKPIQKPKRHSARVHIVCDVVDCAADPRAFIQTLLRAGGKHVRNVEISNE